jgi:Lsr2
MAQKVQTLFIDDLDGSEAEGTVRFALDGAAYEIDLNPVHAQELRGVLSRYTQAARRITGPIPQPGRPSRGKTAEGVSTTQVRDWARQNGVEVKDRGRIPADVVVRFQAATAS